MRRIGDRITGLVKGRRPYRSQGRALAVGLVFALWFASAHVWAGELEVTLTLDPSSVVVGQRAVAVVEVRSAVNIAQISFPPVEGIKIRRGGTQFSTRWVNGVVEQSSLISFVITPRKEGEYTIGPVSVASAKGNVYKTNTTILKVKPTGGMPSDRPADVYVEVEFDPEGPLYLHQPLDITWRLVMRREIRAYSIDVPWLAGAGMEGFRVSAPDDLVERWNSGRRSGLSRIHISGQETVARTYSRKSRDGARETIYELRRVFIPLSAGEFLFKPSMVEANVVEGGAAGPMNDPFFDGFFGRRVKVQTVTADNPEHKIVVRPLPEAGRPESFIGAVGKFTMNASVFPQSIGVGETVTLTVVIEGEGAFDLIGKPKLTLCDVCRPLDPEEETDTTSPTKGRKIFRFPLYMEKAGSVELPPVEAAYFNPETEEYRVLTAGPFKIEVTASQAGDGLRASFVPGGSAARKGVVDLGRDITGIFTSVENLQDNGPRMTGWIFYIFLVAPVVLGVAGGMLLRARRLARADAASMRRRAARTNFRQGLKGGMDAASLLRRYLSDLSGGGVGGEITPVEAAEVTRSATGDEQLASRTAEFLMRLDAARFAPDAAGTYVLRDETADLVERIEKCRV